MKLSIHQFPHLLQISEVSNQCSCFVFPLTAPIKNNLKVEGPIRGNYEVTWSPDRVTWSKHINRCQEHFKFILYLPASSKGLRTVTNMMQIFLLLLSLVFAHGGRCVNSVIELSFNYWFMTLIVIVIFIIVLLLWK